MFSREDSPTVVMRCRECGSSFPDHDWDQCYAFVPEGVTDEELQQAQPDGAV